MKKLALIILAGLLIIAGAGLTPAYADYTDTADLSETELAAVEALSGLGVIAGYPDGSFRPYQPVSRAELAKIICVYAGQSELAGGESPFGDVALTDWFYGWACRAADEGWVTGYATASSPTGYLYRPREAVTQTESAAMLLRWAGLDTSNFKWPDDFIDTAREMGLFTGFAFAAEAKASRLEICLMINNLPQEEAKPQTLTDGLHIGVVKASAAREFTLWQMDEPLPLAADTRRSPKENTLIYFMLKDGVVESWTLLLDAAQGYIAPTTALKGKLVKDGPYAWAATRSGLAVDAPVELNSAKPLVRYFSYRNITVGPNSLDNRNYWLGDDCQIYEASEGKLTAGSRESIETGQAVTLLVNDEEEAIVLIYWK
jgi:hypothetical protein